jgi:hypothetical protein
MSGVNTLSPPHSHDGMHKDNCASFCIYSHIVHTFDLNGDLYFYVLLTLHLGIILVSKYLDSQFFFVYVYFNSLHVSSSHVLIIRRVNFIYKTSGICHSM